MNMIAATCVGIFVWVFMTGLLSVVLGTLISDVLGGPTSWLSWICIVMIWIVPVYFAVRKFSRIRPPK